MTAKSTVMDLSCQDRRLKRISRAAGSKVQALTHAENRATSSASYRISSVVLWARHNHVPLSMMYLLVWDQWVATKKFKAFVSASFAIAFCFLQRNGESATAVGAINTDIAYCEPQPDDWNSRLGETQMGHKFLQTYWPRRSKCFMTRLAGSLEQTTKYSWEVLVGLAIKVQPCTSETFYHSKPPASVNC